MTDIHWSSILRPSRVHSLHITFTRTPRKREKFVILFTTSSFISTMSRQSDAPLNPNATLDENTATGRCWWMKIAQISQASRRRWQIKCLLKNTFNVTGRLYSKLSSFFLLSSTLIDINRKLSSTRHKCVWWLHASHFTLRNRLARPRKRLCGRFPRNLAQKHLNFPNKLVSCFLDMDSNPWLFTLCSSAIPVDKLNSSSLSDR